MVTELISIRGVWHGNQMEAEELRHRMIRQWVQKQAEHMHQ